MTTPTIERTPRTERFCVGIRTTAAVPLRTIAADVVGGVSVLLGGLLLVAPRTSGRWLELDGTSVLGRRALGAADVGLGVAIIAGRSSPWRWRAVAARSALHLVFAVAYARGSRTGHAAGMTGLFAIDAGVAVGLRRGR